MVSVLNVLIAYNVTSLNTILTLNYLTGFSHQFVPKYLVTCDKSTVMCTEILGQQSRLDSPTC
jgi:hypothetical protein